VLILAGVAEAVPEEVDGAALPGHRDHLGDRRLQALVGIGDGELHAHQATGDEPTQELGPESFRLALAHLHADHLASAGLVHAMGDHQALAHDPAPVADLLDLGVEPQVGVAALERALPERLDLVIQALADARDL
jgi:hypothetical protein